MATLFSTIPTQAGPSPQANPFAGTSRITLPVHRAPAGLDVFASDARRVEAYLDEQSDTAIYLWGQAVHPSMASQHELLAWIAARLGESRFDAFAELVGQFVILFDQRSKTTISFVSDVLGVRPWFVGTFQGLLIAGSDVLGICDAGLSRGIMDPDSVSSWLNYNFDCTGGSVVEDYKRLPPGTVCTYDAAGGAIAESRYVSLQFEKNAIPLDSLVDRLHEITSRAFDLLTRGLTDVNVPLSGGFDSRYLCALAAASKSLRLRVATVHSNANEVAAARQVARSLGLPLHVIDVDRHVVDLFADPFAFGADGFPTARNLTSAVARMHPGMPVLSGFMGDVMMRAPLTEGLRNFLAMDDQDLTDEQFTAAAHNRYRMKTNRLDLLQNNVLPGSTARAVRSMRRIIEMGRHAGRPLAFSNLHLRHRLYFAAIFLGHLDIAEAIIPFYSSELIQFHVTHNGSFRVENYAQLFQRHFPAIAHIPHDSELKPAADAGDESHRPSRSVGHARRWSLELLRSVAAGRESGISSRKLVARGFAGLAGHARSQTELMFLYKIHLFEKRLRKAGVKLNWSEI